MPSYRDPSTLGAKVGPKIAKLIVDAIVAAKRALGPHEHMVRVKAAQTVINQAGHEVADLYRPLLQAVLDDPDAPLHDAAREFLEKVASGDQQWHSLAGALGTLGQSALSQAIGNAVAPIAYKINSLGPNLDLDPQTAAQAVAAGLATLDNGRSAARDQGIASNEFDTLVGLAQNIPDITTLNDMVNRGLISEQTAALWTERGAVPAQLRGAALATRAALLPPDLASLAVLRGVISLAEGERIAALSGVSKADFNIMIEDTGEPLGLEQLLEAFRRGFIDQATLRRGILQSRVRNEWIPTAEKLRYSPMSVADAVNAVVQGHLTMAEGESFAQLNGLEPGQFGTLVQTAGEPPSRLEMLELLNRGEVTLAEVKQAFSESRIKDKYIDTVIKLRYRLLEPRVLAGAVEAGSLTYEQAIKYAMDYGYTAELAKVLVGAGSARKMAKYRDRVMSAVETLFEDNAISEAEANNLAKGLGFSADETKFIFEAGNFRRQSRTVNGVIAAIKTKYLARHITKNMAMDLLTALGVPAAQRDYLIEVWSIEWRAYTRQLTEAQIVKAANKKLITEPDALARLLYLGYSAEDAKLLLEGA